MLASVFVPQAATADAAADEAPISATDIPTPDAGDYEGSTGEDEANPGSYAETQEALLQADTLKGFDPGNLISDQKMYTSGTMSTAQIQRFLDGKVATCQSGYTCLKDFTQTTRTKAANSYCSGTYQGASRESAAAIISKASKACGVSEKVLLVMLQKEQGLVTHVWPSDWRYRIAMGYGCPDGAACDAQYFGFQNQVYMAAKQLRRYTLDDAFNWYPVGRTSQVRWHPNASCGTGPVRIENKATAALYYYTPYQPNRAALRAGYGVGDSCSAYGNRNLYNYYTDWFGSTHGGSPGGGSTGYSVTGATAVKWKSMGGAGGVLGDPIDKKNCTSGVGCYQVFKGGSIYYTEQAGAVYVRGAVRDKWSSMGARGGPLGYPTSDPWCGLSQGGCLQKFQGGTMYTSSETSTKYVRGAIRDAWAKTGDRHGRLGYPTTNPRCGGGACTQSFQGGTIRYQGGSSPRVLYG